MVCFLPETVIRATLGTTSDSSLLFDTSLLLAEEEKQAKCTVAYNQRHSLLCQENDQISSSLSCHYVKAAR